MKSLCWIWSCLCIPVQLLVESTNGVTVTLTGSADYAVLDQTFRFTCTVTDEDAPTLGFLSFLKDGSASACVVISSPCSQLGFYTDYSCGCVSGQRDVYYMNVSSVHVQKDEGTWRCQRRSSDSNNIILPVYYGPFNNVTIDKSSPQRVTESSSLTVVCSSTCKPCSYTWSRGTVTVSNTKTLSLTNINRNKAGDYICTATNTKLVTTASSSLTVEVQYKPVISGQDSSYPAVESSPLNIDCSSYTTPGNPSTTSYRWSGPNSYTSTGPVLSINSISKTQTGQYTCTASNTLTPTGGSQQTGTDTGQFLVDVQCGCETSGLGTGLGIGFGVCIPIIIFITLSFIVLYRRKDELHMEEKKKWQDVATVNRIPEPATGRAVYSTLDQDTPTPVYERINPGET